MPGIEVKRAELVRRKVAISWLLLYIIHRLAPEDLGANVETLCQQMGANMPNISETTGWQTGKR